MSLDEKFEQSFRASFIQLIAFNPDLDVLEEHFKFMFRRGCLHGMAEIDQIKKDLESLSKKADEIK